jgi:lysozyme family protein
MVASNWKVSLAAVLKSEGGNDDDPADHGGRTSRGITQREYNAWRKERGQPLLDVWQAPQSDIEVVYHEEYWNPNCDLLPQGMDYLYFDMAVNAGPYRAAVLLQRALGVNDDGRIGPITREAIKDADPIALINNFTRVKEAFYRSLHQPKFLKGWLNRNRAVRATAIAMIQHEGNVA